MSDDIKLKRGDNGGGHPQQSRLRDPLRNCLGLNVCAFPQAKPSALLKGVSSLIKEAQRHRQSLPRRERHMCEHE